MAKHYKFHKPEKNVVYGFRFGITEIKTFTYLNTLPNGKYEMFNTQGKYNTTMTPARFSYLYAKTLAFENPFDKYGNFDGARAKPVDASFIIEETLEVIDVFKKDVKNNDKPASLTGLGAEAIEALKRLSEADKQRFFKYSKCSIESIISFSLKLPPIDRFGYICNYTDSFKACGIEL